MVLTSQPMTLETFRVMYHLTTDQIAMEAFPGMPVEEAKRRWKASELANHTMNPLMSWNIYRISHFFPFLPFIIYNLSSREGNGFFKLLNWRVAIDYHTSPISAERGKEKQKIERVLKIVGLVYTATIATASVSALTFLEQRRY